MGDFGCAVFIVESTNPKNLDLNKNLNVIIIKIEIWNLKLIFWILIPKLEILNAKYGNWNSKFEIQRLKFRIWNSESKNSEFENLEVENLEFENLEFENLEFENS